MNLYKLQLVVLSLILITYGCREEKDTDTLPVDVVFNMELKMGLSMDSSLNADWIHLNDCLMGISRIQFTGKRIEGSSFSFSTNRYTDFQILSSSSWNHFPVRISEFNLPQGTYTDMRWWITMVPVAPEDVVARGATMESLIEQAFYLWWGDEDGGAWIGPGIVLSGTYETMEGSVIPFFMGFDPPYEFIARSFDAEGDSIIDLLVDKSYESTMIMGLHVDASSLDRELFESAILWENNGDPFMILKPWTGPNIELGKTLLSRITLSARVIIE